MAAAPAPHQAVAHVELTVSGVSLKTDVIVNKTATRPREMLPIFQAFAGALQSVSERLVFDSGKAISCQKGCGACCRQLVPISPAEAYAIRELVDAMPEPRRSLIRARFEAAIERVDAEGLRDELTDPGRHDEDHARQLSYRYFAMKVPCPFLDEESCSIHPQRPLRCREYLVTSPARFCAEPDDDNIQNVPVLAKASVAAMRLDDDANKPFLQWLPLIFALRWTQENPEKSPTRNGGEVLSTFLQNLGKEPDFGASTK